MSITVDLPVWTVVSWLMILFLIFTVNRLDKAFHQLETTVLQIQKDDINRQLHQIHDDDDSS